MTISLAGLDMPVLVPAGMPARSLRVLATGRGSVAGSADSWWEDVSVGPGPRRTEPATTAPPWSVRTIARRGCRPGPDGGWTADSTLRAVAEAAVTSLLLKLVPDDLPVDEARRCTEQAGATGRAVAARLADVRTWARATMDVDGSAFVLWVHQRPEGFAAVADLGACRVVLHGLRPPASWRFTLLAPEAALAALAG